MGFGNLWKAPQLRVYASPTATSVKIRMVWNFWKARADA